MIFYRNIYPFSLLLGITLIINHSRKMSYHNASFSNDSLIKTKMCLYYKVTCTNKMCTFAHSKDELTYPMCRFGAGCRKHGCYFYHPGQELPSKDDLFFHATKNIKFVEPSSPKSPHLPKFPPRSSSQNSQNIIPVELIINLDDAQEEETGEKDEQEQEEKDEETGEYRESEEEEKEKENEDEKEDSNSADSNSTAESDVFDDNDIVMTESEASSPRHFSHPSPPELSHFNNLTIFSPQSGSSSPSTIYPPQPKRRMQFEAMVTQDEMLEILSHLRSRGTNPILLSLG